MATDIWGHPISYSDSDAIHRFEAAVGLMNAYQADPVAAIDGVLAEHPGFTLAHAFRAAVLGLATDKAFEAEMARSVVAAEAASDGINDRERGHVAAVRAWLDGDFARATELWGRVAVDYPRDIAAVQFAQLGDFYLGYSHMLRDRVARILPHWTPDVPGYGFVRGMYAFGLEESGDYRRAEQVGREAVALNRQDGWAVHAVAHVMEMEGRHADGAQWLSDGADGWAPGSLFAFHNWWHLALFHIDAGDTQAALRIFDEKIAAGGFPQALELIDGTAMLWRLALVGADVGARWTDIADKWQRRAADGYYAFNDLHAMIALVASHRHDAQTTLLRAAERAAESAGTNAMMTREVGLPAMRAVQAFGRGEYAEAVLLLAPLQGKANRFGGSHAQRDLLSWTLVEAAIRSGDHSLAEAMVAERMARKPQAAPTLAWAARIRRNAGRQAA